MVAEAEVQDTWFAHLCRIVEDVFYGVRDVGVGACCLVERYEDDVSVGRCAPPCVVHECVPSCRYGCHVCAVGVY